MSLTFDEILDLAKRPGPLEYTVKAWGDRKIYVRNPSSADVDQWRMWCSRHQAGDAPLAARLVQIMLCDENGERIIPDGQESLDALADGRPDAIDEIAKFCLPLVSEPSDQQIDDIQKN